MGDRKDFSNGPVWDPERERYFVEARFPDGSRKKKRFRRQREAQRWWTLQIAKIEEGTWNQLVPKNVTLAAAFEEYRKYSKIHHRSYKTLVGPVLKFWEREFGEDTPLAKITTSKIEQVKLRRVQEVSPATVDKSVAVLKAFFSWCDRQGIFNHNPVRTVKLFNPNNELIRYLSTEQYDLLLGGGRKDPLVLAADDCARRSHRPSPRQPSQPSLGSHRLRHEQHSADRFHEKPEHTRASAQRHGD